MWGNPVLKAVSSSKQRTSDEAKTIHWGCFKMSDPPWHEEVLLISQSRQIEWRGGGTRHVDPTTDSRREQSQTRRSRSKEIVFYSKLFVQCPGESSLPQTVTPWFSRLWLRYETCESTRKHEMIVFSTQSSSFSSQLLSEGSVGVFLQKKASLFKMHLIHTSIL